MDTQLNLFPDDEIPAARPRLIAFSGLAGSGKSVAAAVLLSHGFTRVKMADGLKTMLMGLYQVAGLDLDHIHARIEGYLKETPDPILAGRTPRHAMQTLGQEWGRENMHENLWVRIASKAIIHAMTSRGRGVVVDDVRYANEAAMIRKLGGVVYRVHRENSVVSVPSHGSEDLDFEPDDVIINSGSKTDFIQQIKASFL